MKKLLLSLLFILCGHVLQARTINYGQGRLTVTNVARNAVRIQYTTDEARPSDLPDWVYVKHDTLEQGNIRYTIDGQQLSLFDAAGRKVFTATSHELNQGVATLRFESPADESLFGLGQFQDGYANVRGLSRRLTQVNTQISVPMLLSSKGYGVLWNNYGLTEFNPCEQQVALTRQADKEEQKEETVNVTTTEGTRQERRQRNLFEATIDVTEEGDYSLLLDVGQKMARRHNLQIDGQTVIEMQNLWLPPTASKIVHLTRGRHTLRAELTGGDQPVLYYNKVKNQTVFRSPVATAVDYTVFLGTADEIIATYRELTGPSPLMPQWMLGYIHCRERFHSQQEILATANRFRNEQLPVDVLVQDWQYWGKYGWNAMRFDEDHYPDPKALTDSLHAMNMQLMVSVWSKIDKNSEVGKQMEADRYYIPGTDWIDFFNPDAAAAYWRNFSTRLVPLGIDAWWQDATEPENDDLMGRRVNNGRWSGEQVRNVYPLLVNKTVYEGLSSHHSPLTSHLSTRPVILTRCGFPGIQRYGAALWSGDIGNDWETLRRQITAGLGLQAAGIPWWTYDAGGFFRPQNQYSDPAYHERLLRWLQTSVYLPLMRVHGYMSNTEPWHYGKTFQNAFALCLQNRYMLLPYIYSNAAAVSFEGSTLMRPLVFDFADDPEALKQKYEYMFGHALLVSPVVEAGVSEWPTYLPRNKGGWYEMHTARHYDGGQTVTTEAADFIPVFARGGSIVPLANGKKQYAADNASDTLTIVVFPGNDTSFTLYEDDGRTRAYEQGQQSRITCTWDDNRRRLTIGKREGEYRQGAKSRTFIVQLQGGTTQTVTYKGREISICLITTKS
jgi:alpha-D-xyloside xylohydrolase